MSEHDFCSREGALRLKQAIEAYWRERGRFIEVRLVDAGFLSSMRSARTDLRSDIVNGLPPRVDAKAAERAA